MIGLEKSRHALPDAEDRLRQGEGCAFLHQRHQFVELRPGLHPGEQDANGMEERRTLDGGLFLHGLDQRLEALGRDGFGLGGDLCGKRLSTVRLAGALNTSAFSGAAMAAAGSKCSTAAARSGSSSSLLTACASDSGDAPEPSLHRGRKFLDTERALIKWLGQDSNALGLPLA